MTSRILPDRARARERAGVLRTSQHHQTCKSSDSRNQQLGALYSYEQRSEPQQEKYQHPQCEGLGVNSALGAAGNDPSLNVPGDIQPQEDDQTNESSEGQ